MGTFYTIAPRRGHSLTRAEIPPGTRAVAVQRSAKKFAEKGDRDVARDCGTGFNFSFMGFDVDFLFSMSDTAGIIAVDGSVVSGFSFTTVEVAGFHVFLRDMLVSFVNEGIFNVIDMGTAVEMSKIPLHRGDGVLFLDPSARMLAHVPIATAVAKPCFLTPPAPEMPEMNGMTVPVVISGRSLQQLSSMAAFLTAGHFLDMVAAGHDERRDIGRSR